MQLVLASSSPRRREILSYLPMPFVVQTAEVDETPIAGESPEAMVLRLSQAKAQAVVCTYDDKPALVLAADTTVALDGAIIGKPRDAADAESILRSLRNRPHHVYTGVTLKRCGHWVDALHPPNAQPMGRGGKTLVGHGSLLCNDPCPTPQEGFSSLCHTVVHMRNYSDDEVRAYIASASPFDKAGAYAIQDKDFHLGLRLFLLRPLFERLDTRTNRLQERFCRQLNALAVSLR